jgi:hypothetical protein
MAPTVTFFACIGAVPFADLASFHTARPTSSYFLVSDGSVEVNKPALRRILDALKVTETCSLNTIWALVRAPRILVFCVVHVLLETTGSFNNLTSSTNSEL